jgi:ketosteroid isomerase-like protein
VALQVVVMMTPKQVVTEWAAAFNRHDTAAAATLYHDDATNIQVP